MDNIVDLMYKQDNPPDRIKMLPKNAQIIWINAYNSAYKQYNGDEEKCNKIAWGAVKNAGWKKGEDENWVKASDNSNINFVFINDNDNIELSENETSSVVNIARCGKFKHNLYGTIDLSMDVLNEIVRNFNNQVRGSELEVGLPIDISHNTDKGAVGWFRKLYIDKDRKGRDGLFALAEWNSLGRKILKDKRYRHISISLAKEWVDPETNNSYKNVLSGFALTINPYIKGMDEVKLSENLEYIECIECIENNNGNNEEDKNMSNENVITSDISKDQSKDLSSDIMEMSEKLSKTQQELDKMVSLVDDYNKKYDELTKEYVNLSQSFKKREDEILNLRLNEIGEKSKNIVKDLNLKADIVEMAELFLSDLMKVESGIIQLNDMQTKKLSETFLSVVKSIDRQKVDMSEIGHANDVSSMSKFDVSLTAMKGASQGMDPSLIKSYVELESAKDDLYNRAIKLQEEKGISFTDAVKMLNK